MAGNQGDGEVLDHHGRGDCFLADIVPGALMDVGLNEVKKIENSARIIVGSMAALICVGLVMSYSVPAAQYSTEDGWLTFKQRALWLVLGALACALVYRFNLNEIEKRYQMAYGLAIFLLLLVFIPGLGMKLNNARRWIHLPMGQGQPSELAKWCIVIFVAGFIRYAGPDLIDFKKGFVRSALLIGFVCGLVVIEPDFGTTMMMGAVAGAMLLIGGARLKYVAAAVGVGLLGMVGLILHSPGRVGRVMAFLDPEKGGEAGYQQLQSLIALGSGGLFGKGLGASGRKLAFLPEPDSDFVFSVIGEELGLIGCLVVLTLLVLLVYHGLRISRLSRDPFRSLLAFGITFAIGLQSLINLAVVTACAPTKGIALPFISHGGSSLVAMMIGVGFILAVGRMEAAERRTELETAAAVNLAMAETARKNAGKKVLVNA
jgi:cell division protein FtsW